MFSHHVAYYYCFEILEFLYALVTLMNIYIFSIMHIDRYSLFVVVSLDSTSVEWKKHAVPCRDFGLVPCRDFGLVPCRVVIKCTAAHAVIKMSRGGHGTRVMPKHNRSDLVLQESAYVPASI